jgi:type II secretory pathway pseudopilin PulG
MSISRQHGYTYLTLIFAVAFMGAGLAAASSLWHTAQMREKERELLYVGDQYRKAIQLYYAQGNQYPKELVQLLRDQRVQGVRRYLRKLYRDPITGKSEWGFVKVPDGGIVGVYSLSEQTPFKQADFPKDYAEFTGKTKYSDWKFAYMPQGKPGATPPQGSSGQGSPQGAQGAGSPGATPQGTPGAASSPGAFGVPSPGAAAPTGTPGAASSPGVFGVPSPGAAAPTGAPGGAPAGASSGTSTQGTPGGLGGLSQPAAPGRSAR